MMAAKAISKAFSFRSTDSKIDTTASTPKNGKVSMLSSSSSHLNLKAPSAGTAESFNAKGNDTTSETSSESAFASATMKETFGSSMTLRSVAPSDQIKVAVRVRPLLLNEKEGTDKKAWEWDNNSIQLLEADVNIFNPHSRAVKQAYQFDHLFDPESTNNHIFESVVKNIVRSSMEGFHGSVFTYGQTSSGKTFTMNGDKDQPGIIPQAIAECFQAVQDMPGRDFILRVSYLEVYNEQIKDLLSMDPVPVRIQHDPKRGTVLTGVKEQVVLNTQQVLALIKSGEAHRHVGSTDMNEKSSRAHTLFKIIIESTSTDKKEAIKVSTLYLVDLAGSESAKMTNSKGERAREAKYINQSLLTLSTIIQRLSEDRSNSVGGKRTQHLPYRDSKLTRILEQALDGNAQIGIICTVSPTFKCMEETSNTLKFASRAKMIKMQAKVNETMDDKTLLRVYKEEIEQLRVRLQELEMQTRLQQTMKTADTDEGTNHHHRRDHSSESLTGWDASEHSREVEEEDANVMLQMIAEMERLILRADGSKALGGTGRLSHQSGRPSDGSAASPANKTSLSTKPKKKKSTPTKVDLKDSDLIDVSATIKALKQQATTTATAPKRKTSSLGASRSRFRNSSAAMLSFLMEATDSDNLMRLDTLDELDVFEKEDRGSRSESGSSDEGGEHDYDESVHVVSESMDEMLMVSTDDVSVTGSSAGMAMGTIYNSNSLDMLDMEINEEDRASMEVANTLESILLRVEGKPTFDALVPSRDHSSASSHLHPHRVVTQQHRHTSNPMWQAGSRRETNGTMIPRPASSQASRHYLSHSKDEDESLFPVTSAASRLHSWDECEGSASEGVRDSLASTSEEDHFHTEAMHELTQGSATSTYSSSVTGLTEPLESIEEGDNVLLGVSKMLVVLKGHVSKARSRCII